MKVLVTGGAGFIGSHIVDALIREGHRVSVLDSIHPQVHPGGKVPSYMPAKAEFVRGDIRNRRLVSELVSRVDAIYHEAARVGVGQSMYEIEEYADINVRGTAILLEILATQSHKIKKLLVASSMSIYGEGAYRCPRCGLVQMDERRPEDMAKGIYDPICRKHRLKLEFAPTPESKSIRPTSIYASTKRDQEEMCLMIGRAYGIPTVAFRYFNVYGPRQSLSNPYTGVLAIFGSRLLNNRAPLIFEDGNQSRDFVHVRDVAAANVLALENSKANGRAFNVGTGVPRTIQEIATGMAEVMQKSAVPKILGEYRIGDIRHCIADNRQIRKALGWTPEVSWERGLEEYVDHIRRQRLAATDRVDRAMSELRRNHLRRKIKS